MHPPRRDPLLNGALRSVLLGALVAASGGLGACLVDPTPCFAEDEPGPTINDFLPSSEPELTRDQWRQRIDEARQRAKEASREHREHPELYKPVPEDPDLVATERILNDESLQRGDIVTTKKGTFIYQGRSDQPRREQDFVPVAPKPGR
ncbi:hypothetical protein [Bradyrhizobium sp. CCBAU 51745]|uniref:hypothetical protein n=1 Tax=Bradyrhizobium sp. CCBAU 51745 TaxID=1325099 RepID=UPI002306501F|nr:hypothetical protein [Bradyrhizobium sp. CCBAU 51745]